MSVRSSEASGRKDPPGQAAAAAFSPTTGSRHALLSDGPLSPEGPHDSPRARRLKAYDRRFRREDLLRLPVTSCLCRQGCCSSQPVSGGVYISMYIYIYICTSHLFMLLGNARNLPQ